MSTDSVLDCDEPLLQSNEQPNNQQVDQPHSLVKHSTSLSVGQSEFRSWCAQNVDKLMIVSVEQITDEFTDPNATLIESTTTMCVVGTLKADHPAVALQVLLFKQPEGTEVELVAPSDVTVEDRPIDPLDDASTRTKRFMKHPVSQHLLLFKACENAAAVASGNFENDSHCTVFTTRTRLTKPLSRDCFISVTVVREIVRFQRNTFVFHAQTKLVPMHYIEIRIPLPAGVSHSGIKLDGSTDFDKVEPQPRIDEVENVIVWKIEKLEWRASLNVTVPDRETSERYTEHFLPARSSSSSPVTARCDWTLLPHVGSHLWIRKIDYARPHQHSEPMPEPALRYQITSGPNFHVQVRPSIDYLDFFLCYIFGPARSLPSV